MKDKLAVLMVESERVKKMSAFGQLAAVPTLLAMLFGLIGEMIDQIEKLKGGDE